MAKYKAYPEYKDSGVDSFGCIPKQWSVLRLKYIFEIKKRIAGALGFDILSVTQRGIKIKDIDSGEGQLSMDYSKYQRVLPGDFAMNHMDLLTGYVDISNYDGVTSPDYRVFSVRDSNDFYSRYFLYLLQDGYKQRRFFHLGQGSAHLGRWRLPTEAFNGILYPLPSLEEQLQIAAFLDHETAKIDNLIEKQQQLIELLKEKRQAVISHAVTKGLNPDVPMKDSGVEWLGEVPEHWGITKLKWVGRTTSGGTPTTSKFEIYYEDGHIPWIRTTDLSNGELFDTPIRITSKAVNDTACSILPVGSVLLGMYGGAGSIGKHAILRFESTINQAVCGVLPCARILPDYLHKYYEFYRPFWMVDAAGTRKDPNIGQDNIKEGIILIPPFEEQIEINNHIDIMRNIYECIIENALEGVGLLQERRTALISAAVTGKIDVRDWVAPNACEAEVSQEATA